MSPSHPFDAGCKQHLHLSEHYCASKEEELSEVFALCCKWEIDIWEYVPAAVGSADWSYWYQVWNLNSQKYLSVNVEYVYTEIVTEWHEIDAAKICFKSEFLIHWFAQHQCYCRSTIIAIMLEYSLSSALWDPCPCAELQMFWSRPTQKIWQRQSWLLRMT